MTRGSLIAIFIFIPFISWTQPATEDSLKNLLQKKTLTETERADVLNELAYRIRVSFSDQAVAYAQEALILSKSIQYKIGECDANVVLGLVSWLKAAPEKGLGYGLSALKISESADYKKGVMEANLLLGLVYNELKDFKKAEDFTRQGLATGLEIKHAEGIARACNTLGNHCRRRNDGKEALRYYQMGLSYLENKKDFSIKNLLLNNIALYYINRDEEREKTKKYLDEAMQIALAFKNKNAELLTRLRLAAYYKNLKDFSKSEEQFRISESISVDLGQNGSLLEVYKGLGDMKMEMGLHQASRVYQQKYATLKDSMFNLERAKQIAELETRYETEKKEQTIRLLEQEKQIQNILQNVLLGGLLLSAFVTITIYKLQQSRTRKAKELLQVQHQLNDKLKEVDKIKSGFFANISHEFRTPLTLILAPLEEALKKPSAGDEKEMLLLMKRNGNRLLELVNQLLDLSKLEAGKMELRVRLGSAEYFLKLILASFNSWAQHKHIRFNQSLEAREELWYDQDKVEKIVTNLLSNAFKFTPAGGTVTFRVTSMEKDAGKILSIVISDTGKGIPEEEQEQVFSPFYQTRQTVDSYQEGTGLGLSLVKELVKLYGGTITLQSKVGAGTTFSIELPADKKAFTDEQREELHPETSPVPRAALEFIKEDEADLDQEMDVHAEIKDIVLIAEDNADLQNFIFSVLKDEFSVLIASNGEEALQLALREVPGLVLTDLMMPGLDGIQLTKRLKADERTSHIPVIVLTARNESQSRLEGLKTGADDYLTKPFSTEELKVRIANLIGQRKQLAQRFREKILVSATPAAGNSMEEKFLLKSREVVETYLSDFTFTVEKMAIEVGMSRTQLLRKIKALTGLSSNDFIKDLRLKRAADMINQKSDTITQIGYAVGFNDQSYFTKCFKKQFGVTPSEFSQQRTQV